MFFTICWAAKGLVTFVSGAHGLDNCCWGGHMGLATFLGVAQGAWQLLLGAWPLFVGGPIGSPKVYVITGRGPTRDMQIATADEDDVKGTQNCRDRG